MKLSNQLAAIAIISVISSATFAAGQFFEVGKSYLFVPRLNMVFKGTVTQVTDQEVVFKDRAILKASKAAATVQNDDAKSGSIKSEAIAEFLKSKNREALLDPSLVNAPVSYSRSELTAIKIDS